MQMHYFAVVNVAPFVGNTTVTVAAAAAVASVATIVVIYFIDAAAVGIAMLV